jgi:hypothetical protein
MADGSSWRLVADGLADSQRLQLTANSLSSRLTVAADG